MDHPEDALLLTCLKEALCTGVLAPDWRPHNAVRRKSRLDAARRREGLSRECDTVVDGM